MHFPTLSEVKTILGISGTVYDTKISARLPILRDKIVAYLNQCFTQTDMYIQGDMEFTASGLTIEVEVSEDFSLVFRNGDDILVSGTLFNDGYYFVDTVAAQTLTLRSGQTILHETIEGCAVQRVVFPNILEPVSQMIDFDIVNPRQKGVKSYSTARYSETLEEKESALGGYPVDIVGSLRPFKRVRFY